MRRGLRRDRGAQEIKCGADERGESDGVSPRVPLVRRDTVRRHADRCNQAESPVRLREARPRGSLLGNRLGPLGIDLDGSRMKRRLLSNEACTEELALPVALDPLTQADYIEERQLVEDLMRDGDRASLLRQILSSRIIRHELTDDKRCRLML